MNYFVCQLAAIGTSLTIVCCLMFKVKLRIELLTDTTSHSYGASLAIWDHTVVLVVALVERWTRDRKDAGSTPGRGAIKSTRSTQPSVPRSRQIEYRPAWLGL